MGISAAKPVRLERRLVEKIWGQTELRPWISGNGRKIGEVWYLDEEDAPLLVKLIFTSERVSVQVHPDDDEAGPRGKTEMWHILSAGPGASIALGFEEPITRERLAEAARSGEIEKLVKWFPVQAGETYYTPAHTVHAIGGGIVLCEIQQRCDVTYRLWDYGRDRELHLEKAVAIADLNVHPGKALAVRLDEERELLVNSKHFVTEAVHLPAGTEYRPEREASQLWMCLEGSGMVDEDDFSAGDVWKLPEDAEAAIRPRMASRFLRTYVPRRASMVENRGEA